MLKEITAQEYKETVEGKVTEPYLLVFHALWCGPCRMFKESLSELAEKDNVLVYRVNIDENSELASQFQVRSIPTWFVFKDGKQLVSHNGFLPYEDLKNVVDSIR
ncbi:Thioredoxin [Mycoplasmopsis agalactiae 14628]|uniref:Thioredoxin n=1 Tax=Mycoplasmopsis agalactiae 14628 TaxID=1110504 RepID=I5D559_MYCAA|nr:thioredoxin family protein [Mycoplasmopsis agalactiae]EIN14818.1 Thioredoxin [Mycoplasmopsis agalactiae 14628]